MTTTPTMQEIKIEDFNGCLIAVLQVKKTDEYLTIAEIESALGRKLKPGECIVFNS